MGRNRPCLAEQETIIRWDNEIKEAVVYTYDRKLIRRLRELEKEYPDEYIFVTQDIYGAVTYQIPKRYVTVRLPYNEDRRQRQIIDARDNRDLFVKKDMAKEKNRKADSRNPDKGTGREGTDGQNK